MTSSWGSNPDTSVHAFLKYILKVCESSSSTWSNHVQLLCHKYNLPCPLKLLELPVPWSKSDWKCLVKTKVTAYHEKEMRSSAASNSKMQYLNVQLCGLIGHPHPALLNIFTS